ncbi:fork head domain-containing protein, partial [Hysterangium stoloniferum]
MYPSVYPSSPTPRPKRQVSKPSISLDVSHSPPVPYTLPPGPYSPEKPSWSLAALIGQAINASHSGALPLNDIYTYVSTVYPHFDRRDQAWMSSVRHSLSVNDAFERV